MRNRTSALLRERLTPPRLLVFSFLGLIFSGTLGLKILPGLYTGEPLSWLNAFFTATSAVCVTGLIVVDTASYFTVWGQALLLILIQLGGLGILTFATLAILAIGKRLSLSQEALTTQAMEVVPELNTRRTVRNLVIFTFAAEGLGALLLFFCWVGRFSPGDALWHSVFQSVSAVCNAGFSTFSDSLTRFGHSWPTQLVIMALIVLGGLGFLTLEEVRILRKKKRTGWAAGLSLHSRLVLTTTTALLVGGWGLYLLLEWGNTLAVFAPAERLLNAMFMSVTARTAGFNTVDYGATADSTNFVTMLLMSVGGSPGSTAGGLKTTTFALIGLLALARLRGSPVAGAWGRSVPAETVQRAVGLFVLAFGTVTLGILLISVLEIGGIRHGRAPGVFIAQMFEMVSAFNTVGLSMGATSDLSGGGRLLTILLMFLGRVGPLTMA
ncbi:MAG: potassium transporter TrkG, partial [Gemmatimonadota bacterium]